MGFMGYLEPKEYTPSVHIQHYYSILLEVKIINPLPWRAFTLSFRLTCTMNLYFCDSLASFFSKFIVIYHILQMIQVITQSHPLRYNKKATNINLEHTKWETIISLGYGIIYTLYAYVMYFTLI